MSEPKPSTIVFRSGIHATEKWDVMQVVFKSEKDQIINSYTLARDHDGRILRKTDIVLDRWEVMNDDEDLRICRNHFDMRDRLAAEEEAKTARA